MNRPSLEELADSLCAAFPKLDDAQRRLALATYRRLARGMAASPAEIAEDAGIETEKAQRVLGDWSGVYSDEAKRVMGTSRSTVRSSTPGAPGMPFSFRRFWGSRRRSPPPARPAGNRFDSAFLRNSWNRSIQARSASPSSRRIARASDKTSSRTSATTSISSAPEKTPKSGSRKRRGLLSCHSTRQLSSPGGRINFNSAPSSAGMLISNAMNVRNLWRLASHEVRDHPGL